MCIVHVVKVDNQTTPHVCTCTLYVCLVCHVVYISASHCSCTVCSHLFDLEARIGRLLFPNGGEEVRTEVLSTWRACTMSWEHLRRQASQ